MGVDLSILKYLAIIIIPVTLVYIFWNIHFFIRVIITLPRDFRLLYKMISWNIFFRYNLKRKRTILNYFYTNFLKYPNEIAFVGIGGNSYTFRQFEEMSTRLTIFFQNKGFKAGDCIGILMNNTPEFILMWYSLAKIKIISSFLNSNLTGKALEHCMLVSKISAVIFDVEFTESIKGIDYKNYDLYSFGGPSNIPNSVDIHQEIKSVEPRKITPVSDMNDILCYIFTSGSTGLPKPAIIRHSKAFHLCQALYMANITQKDNFYAFMPLYHSNTGLVVVSYCFIFGTKLFIRKKFSVSNFDKDCIDNKITAFNYIGEVCRYLISQKPPTDEEKLHFKCIVGNGLRESSWMALKQRYKIDHIYEFYGSTEGNIPGINTNNKIGACGFYPIWIKRIFPFCVVKCNEEGEIILDKNNHAILCESNEPGHIIGQINQKGILTKFDGYVNKKDTDKKIKRDVFRKGDSYYLSGDIIRQDEYGYLYFYDRVGDTYRWKGENVSTTEVENILINKLANKDIIAYGVHIPGHEGKAGMVAIHNSDIQLDALILNKIMIDMPNYQKPIFVLLLKNLPMTSTMKYMKADLKKQGFCLDNIKDPIYVLIPKEGYTLLSPELYKNIELGNISF